RQRLQICLRSLDLSYVLMGDGDAGRAAFLKAAGSDLKPQRSAWALAHMVGAELRGVATDHRPDTVCGPLDIGVIKGRARDEITRPYSDGSAVHAISVAEPLPCRVHGDDNTAFVDDRDASRPGVDDAMQLLLSRLQRMLDLLSA